MRIWVAKGQASDSTKLAADTDYRLAALVAGLLHAAMRGDIPLPPKEQRSKSNKKQRRPPEKVSALLLLLLFVFGAVVGSLFQNSFILSQSGNFFYFATDPFRREENAAPELLSVQFIFNLLWYNSRRTVIIPPFKMHLAPAVHFVHGKAALCDTVRVSRSWYDPDPGGNEMKLLLVEDEKRMAQALCELLRLEKYDVDWCADGNAGMNAIESGIYDLIVLDVMLPGKSGFEIARQTRRLGLKTPILMLTAKGEVDDKVTGLDSGADDYLTKPFMTKELLARLRALGRRSLPSPDGSLTFGDISLDADTVSLRCLTNGQRVRLSEKEYRLLEYLIANQGHVLTREQFAEKIWGFESEAEYNNVEVYMSFTRRKLAFVGAKTEIKAVRGIGYELRCGDV